VILLLGVVALILAWAIPQEHQLRWDNLKEHRALVLATIFISSVLLVFLVPRTLHTEFFTGLVLIAILGQLLWLAYSVRSKQIR